MQNQQKNEVCVCVYIYIYIYIYIYVTMKHVQDGIIEDQENVPFCTVFHLIKAVRKLQPNGCSLVNHSALKQNVLLTSI